MAEDKDKIKKEGKEKIKEVLKTGASVEHPVEPSMDNPFTQGDPEQASPAEPKNTNNQQESSLDDSPKKEESKE